LAGALSAAFLAAAGKPHNIPAEILDEVMVTNALDLASLAARLAAGSPSGSSEGKGGKRRDS